MSRWTSECLLVRVEVEVGPDGAAREVRRARPAWCNMRAVGATALQAAAAAGLAADAEIELRSCDYGGEQALTHAGVEYEVERARDGGEYTRLTLKRRLRNG